MVGFAAFTAIRDHIKYYQTPFQQDLLSWCLLSKNLVESFDLCRDQTSNPLIVFSSTLISTTSKEHNKWSFFMTFAIKGGRGSRVLLRFFSIFFLFKNHLKLPDGVRTKCQPDKMPTGHNANQRLAFCPDLSLWLAFCPSQIFWLAFCPDHINMNLENPPPLVA